MSCHTTIFSYQTANCGPGANILLLRMQKLKKKKKKLTEWLIPHIRTLRSGSFARNRRNLGLTALICFVFCFDDIARRYR